MKEESNLENYKNNVESTRPWDVINPKTEWANDELSNERYSICKICPELIKLTKQCRKCGCFMAIKTKLQNATCPIGKW